MCLYLVANEYNRIACFFVLNKPAPLCNIYTISLTKKWMRITRIILKLGIVFIIIKGVFDAKEMYSEYYNVKEVIPIRSGVYDVNYFVVNNDTIPPLITDTLRWQDVIFEKGGMGSIKTMDTIFRKRYGRAYFGYTTDTIKQLLNIKNFAADSINLLTFKYFMPDSNIIQLRGQKNNDSLYIELIKSKRHFQLSENQFHWLSEKNR